MNSEILVSMLNDMSKYHRDRKALFSYYVNKRLTKSLEVYYNDLSNSVNYLKDKSSSRVLKSINE